MNSENLININNYEEDQIKEAYTEGEFILADYFPPIMRIVRSEAKAMIRSKEIRSEKLTVEGSVEVSVMYISEDGALTPCVHTLPFTLTSDIGSNSTHACNVAASVSYLNTRALSPQKLYLKASVEIQISYVQKIEFSALIPGSENGLYTRDTTLNSFEITCMGRKPLKITDEIKTEAQIKSILRYDVFFNETEQKILTGKLISKADMLLKIVYLTADGKIKAYEQKIPISQILDMEGISDETICGVKYALTECRINPEVFGESVSSSIIYEITADVEAFGYQACKHFLCNDVFSLTNSINCKEHIFKSVCFSRISKEQSFRETFNIGLYDTICDVSVLPAVLSTDHNKENGILSVSGTFSCRALYTDENGEYTSVEKEIPFMLPVQTEISAETVNVSADVRINSFAYVENDNNSVELRIDCAYKGFIFASSDISVITEIEVSEELPPKATDKMILYYADKDENVWDIAKKYRVSPEMLMKTNGLSEEKLVEAIMLRL